MKFKDLKYVKGLDIQEVGNVYETKASNIKVEERIGYDIDDEMLENDDVVIFADFNDLIDKYDFECCDFDEEVYNEFVNDLIKDSKYYLGVDFGANWRGAVGYGFMENKEKCFKRGYECSQYVKGASVGGKTLSIVESSHDCPTGAEVLLIALSEKEYKMLQRKDFEEIIDFANGKKKSVKYI